MLGVDLCKVKKYICVLRGRRKGSTQEHNFKLCMFISDGSLKREVRYRVIRDCAGFARSCL